MLLVTNFVVHRVYAKPHCAVIDCATGKVVDDGCVNGICMACATSCGQFN
ncbi:MAG TPA: hypothetical protein VGH28_00275 [Polyangiaceae bacterium]|jgi:hypothetical protein